MRTALDRFAALAATVGVTTADGAGAHSNRVDDDGRECRVPVFHRSGSSVVVPKFDIRRMLHFGG